MGKAPSIYRKIRKSTTNSPFGDTFAITIPRDIADEFSGTYFKIHKNNNTIFLESGCRLPNKNSKRDVNKYFYVRI